MSQPDHLPNLGPLIAECGDHGPGLLPARTRQFGRKARLLNSGIHPDTASTQLPDTETMLHGEAIKVGNAGRPWLSTQGSFARKLNTENCVFARVEIQSSDCTGQGQFPTEDIIEKSLRLKNSWWRNTLLSGSGLGWPFVSDRTTRSDLASAVGVLRESAVL